MHSRHACYCGMIVGLVAAGYSTEEILAAYPYLEAPDIREVLIYHVAASEGYLEERAKRGSKQKFLAAMAKVVDVKPLDERDRWLSVGDRFFERMLAEARATYEIQENDTE